MTYLRLLFLVLVMASHPAWAVDPSERLSDPGLETRARALSKELRCMVCQNESIDDLNADLAHDLRVVVRQRLVAGDSDAQVLDYMRARYGDFILLNPPLYAATWVLWFGPLGVVVLGGAAIFLAARGRRTIAPPEPLSADESQALQKLLESEPGLIMTIWFVFGGLTAAVLLLLIRPLMRRAEPDLPRDSFDQEVYRDQLAEVARDLGRGVIAETDAKAVRLEVERRLLGAATRSVGLSTAKEAARLRPAPALATVLILIVPAMAIGLYAGLGAPDTPDNPFSGRAVERAIESDDGSLDLAKVKAALEARLAKDPNSLEGWVLLARSDGTAQDWAGAHTAWTKALTLSHNDPDVLQDFGEMLVMQDQGAVGGQAKALFQQAASAEKTAFRARFYLGVAKIQAGDRKGGLADWQAIEKDAPPNSPWRGQIAESIKQLDQPAPSAAPPPGVDPGMAGMVMNLPPDQRQQMIQGMVAGLAARLDQNPDDLPGWKRLAHSYEVLGQPQQSADAFAQAAKLDPKDPSLLVGEADAIGSAAPDGSPPSAAMLALYTQALALDPKQPDSLWMLGLAAHGSHHDNVAAGYWQRLLATLDPSSQDYADVKKALGSLGHS